MLVECSRCCHVTAALLPTPTPTPWLGEPHSGLHPGWGPKKRLTFSKGLPSEVQGSHALPRLSAHSLQPQCDGRCCPWTCHCPVESMTRTKLLPQPPPLPFPAFFIFFSIKICLRCSSIRAWRINMQSRSRETPGLKALLPPPQAA